MESSTQRVLQLLDLVRDIGECRDMKQACVAVMRRYTRLFGEFGVMGIVLTDTDCDCWRCLILHNPNGPPAQALPLHRLPPNTDVEQIVNSMGHDITGLVHYTPELQKALVQQLAPFVATQEESRNLLPALSQVLQNELGAVIAASQPRPLERGRCWILIGWHEAPSISDETLALFDYAVDITIRLSGYLSLYNQITRLERINQSVRRNIVHDLKTPLTVIKGCADTILQFDDDPELRLELTHDINDQAQRLLEDLQEILASSEAVNGNLVCETLDLALVVNKAVMAEKHTERSQGHAFEVQGTQQPLLIQGDLRKLRRVIENLLSNAVKYSPGEGKTVRIHLQTRDNQAVLSFQDEGIGLSPEQLKRVLQAPGRVVHESLGIEGSGFGLDSCRQILELHGGTLQAASECGQGSTFTICLPLNADTSSSRRKVLH